jgi:nucleoid DNA-binding protein
MALTKSDLIEEMSERLDLPPPEAKELFENLLETIKTCFNNFVLKFSL